MLWLTNISEWNKLSLESRLEALKQYYCSGGPSGASCNIDTTRNITNKTLNEAIERLKS